MDYWKKKIRHVLGYFSSTLQKFIIFLTLIVEVNFPKIKWIMGVCDLNYWSGLADICPYLSATFDSSDLIWLHNKKMCLCSNHRVSPIQKIGRFVWRESFLWSDPIMSCMIWTGSVRSSRISDWHNPDYVLYISLTK